MSVAVPATTRFRSRERDCANVARLNAVCVADAVEYDEAEELFAIFGGRMDAQTLREIEALGWSIRFCEQRMEYIARLPHAVVSDCLFVFAFLRLAALLSLLWWGGWMVVHYREMVKFIV